MIRDRLAGYRDRVRQQLVDAFHQDHTAHQIGVSFAIGLFVAALPSGGLSIGVLAAIAYWWSWVSVPAITAAVAVLNPLVKPLVYAASLKLGGFVLGTGGLIPTGASTQETVLVGAQQLVVGNLLLAGAFAVVGYLTAVWLTRLHRYRYGTDVDPQYVASQTTIIESRQ